MIALTAARLFTPLDEVQDPLLLLEDGRIAELTSRRAHEIPQNCKTVDFPGAVLAPGYLDIHIHGSAGYDVMDSSPQALPSVEGLLARHGVSSYIPTTVTAPLDKTLAALERLATAVEEAKNSSFSSENGTRARPLGIHLEGPFISHANRGVHPAEDILPPTRQMFEKFWEAARGHISILTIAPEVDGALEVIEEASRRGVCVSLGHSDSDLQVAQTAITKGARHATHTFNAMRSLDHRHPGILGAVLTDDRVTADIIVDGIHVAPSVVELFLKAKGGDKAVLITDATSATGMPDGRYRLGSLEVDVVDGRCTAAGGKLAGSVLNLDEAVRNVVQFAHWELRQAVRLATVNPASVLRLNHKAVLEPGADADILVLDPKGEVKKTIIAGLGI